MSDNDPLSQLKIAASGNLDRDRFADFYVQCFEAEYHTLFDAEAFARIMASVKSEQMDQILHGADDAKVVVAYLDDAIIGTIVYAERQARVYMWGLYIAPQFLRKSVGSQLMRFACHDVQKDSLLEVQVLQDSTKALLFYEKLGFVKYNSSIEEVFPDTFLPIDYMNCKVETCLETLDCDRG